MKIHSFKKISIYWFIIFLLPFITYIILSSSDTFFRAYSQAVFIVLLVASAIECSILYLQNVRENTEKEGVIVGATWFILSFTLGGVIYVLLLDGFAEYFINVGVYYFIVPIISSGVGLGIREWNKNVKVKD